MTRPCDRRTAECLGNQKITGVKGWDGSKGSGNHGRERENKSEDNPKSSDSRRGNRERDHWTHRRVVNKGLLFTATERKYPQKKDRGTIHQKESPLNSSKYVEFLPWGLERWGKKPGRGKACGWNFGTAAQGVRGVAVWAPMAGRWKIAANAG